MNFMPTPHSQHFLNDAIDHYSDKGFEQIAVPWAVSEAAINATKPPHLQTMAISQLAPNGCLVGSAEQSFIQMMLDKNLKQGAYVAITPCFRHEEKYTQWIQPYFTKVELIFYGDWVKQSDIKVMTDIAYHYMKQHLKVIIIETEEESGSKGSQDVICVYNNIELGSYGMREFEGHKWVYGTGLAEPRFSLCIRDSENWEYENQWI